MILKSNKPKGFSRQTMRIWGILFLVAGIISRVMMLYLIPDADLSVMLGTMDDPNAKVDQTALTLVIVSLILQLIGSCGIPIFCFLLVEGFMHTSDVMKYMLRVLGVAVLSELPYDFTVSGKIFDFSIQNPVFAMLLCLIIMYFYKRYEEKGFKNFLIKAMVSVLGLVWAEMLRIEHGYACVIVVGILWLLRKAPTYRVLGGCAAMFGAFIFKMNYMYLLAPLAFLMMHSYNEEPGEGNQVVNYLAYPVLLLVIGVAAYFVL